MKAMRLTGDSRPLCGYRAYDDQHLADYRVEDESGRRVTACREHLFQFTKPETVAELNAALEEADLEAATGATG